MSYGIPYQGNKQSIAASLALNFPKAAHFYDLFGGGGAVTHYMAMHKAHCYKHFHYNEIKSDVVDILRRSIKGEFANDVFKPKWISREEFFELKDNDAYVRFFWSFGNGQRSYLFSKEIEPYKKSLHQAVVFDQFDGLATNTLGLSKWPASISSITKRRSYLSNRIERFRKSKIPDHLIPFLNKKQFEQLNQLKQLQQLKRLQQLQQLEALERLQQLQQLQQLEQLNLYSMDYRDVPIEANSVVYCDIPYIGTAGYGNSFDHKAFYDWAMTREFPVYVSEYSMRDPRFKLIYSIDKRLLMASDKTVVNKAENLYWNGINC